MECLSIEREKIYLCGMKKRLLFLIFALTLGVGAHAQEVRNIIFMIGDGMGLGAVSATMVDQNYAPMALDRAQFIGLQRTYSFNNRVTDSAASGTALATGVKTYNGAIGVGPDSLPVYSTLQKAGEKGFATGVVVTCYLPHATPAAFVAHQPSRKMEEEIAADFVKAPLDVMIGGGSDYFSAQVRYDGCDLAGELQAKGFLVTTDRAEADAVTSGKLAALLAEGYMPPMVITEKVIAMAAREKVPAPREGRGDYLPWAISKALEILPKQSPQGFFLMVEGSQIDTWAHEGDIEAVLAETRDFDAAVKVAMDFADRTPGTLVVVTADHETGGITLPEASQKAARATKTEIAFSTKGHSGTLVPVYAYGAGAEKFAGIYENTEIAKKMQQLLQIEN